MYDKRLIIIPIVLIVSLGLIIRPFSVFAGGWEVNDSIYGITVNNKGKILDGLHEAIIDVDDESTGVPDISVTTGYVYNVKQLSTGEWVHSDEPYLVDTYTKKYTNGTVIYSHYVYAYDVIIKTQADTYYKPWPAVDYGYYYEAEVAKVRVSTKFSINEWNPSGVSSDGNWKLTGGHAGVMSVSILDLDYGLVEKGASENAGHTITNLNTIGQALNMKAEFNDESSLINAPRDVRSEVHADLAAGAEYSTDVLGHWNSIAVRNVYVKYTLRVDVVTVLNYVLISGHQEAVEPPEEDNTAYAPQNTVLSGIAGAISGFFGGIYSFLTSPQMFIILIIVAVIVIIIMKVMFKVM